MDPIWLQNSTHWYGHEPQLEALPFNPWQLVLIVVYSSTAFISLGSNALTIMILVRSEQVSTELWKFLFNLSISDMLMAAFCIPFTYTNYMLGRWIFPGFLCPIIPFLQITSVSVSIWTLTIIGIDRFFAIVYPFRQMMWLKRHKVSTITGIWVLGAVIGAPELFYSRTESFRYKDQEYEDCREQFGLEAGRMYTVFIFAFTFFIPMVALIFVYVRIGVHLWRDSSAPGNPDQNRDRACIVKKIKVIKMLATIVLLFAVCWFPIHLFQLLVWFYPSIQRQKTTLAYYMYVGCYFVCHWLAMGHSLVNPFVYCFMSDNFRKSLHKSLQTCLSRHPATEPLGIGSTGSRPHPRQPSSRSASLMAVPDTVTIFGADGGPSDSIGTLTVLTNIADYSSNRRSIRRLESAPGTPPHRHHQTGNMLEMHQINGSQTHQEPTSDYFL